MLIFVINYLHITSCIQTTEEAENLEIARSMRVRDQKLKYDLEWPNVPGTTRVEGRGRGLKSDLISLLMALYRWLDNDC